VCVCVCVKGGCRKPADELSDWSSRALNTLFGLSNENVGDMGPSIQAVITLHHKERKDVGCKPNMPCYSLQKCTRLKS
jgi:hypothetical protein